MQAVELLLELHKAKQVPLHVSSDGMTAVCRMMHSDVR
jgi:hypothetical protein